MRAPLGATVDPTVETTFTPPPPLSRETAALVRAARQGDRVAFERLYGDFAATIHGVLVAHVPRSEVDDLMQEVFLQAFRQLPGLRDDDSFRAWLLAICRNRAHDFHRRRRGAVVALDPEADAAAPSEPGGGDDANEAGRVLAVLQQLPEAYRETLALRLVEGMTGPEIAERTGLTAGSVRVNLHRGMKLLRERLAPERSEHVGE